MNRWKYTGLILFTTLLMGSAFPVGKMGIAYAPPFLLMGLRFLLAGGALTFITNGKLRPRGGKQWLQAAAVGLFQSAGVMGCAYYSMRWITSGESAILTCTNPLLVVVFGSLSAGVQYRPIQWLGVFAGFAGVAFSFGFHIGMQPGTFIGFAGAVCFAAATLLIKRWGAAFDMTVLAAWQMVFGGLILLALSALTEQPHFALNAASITILLWLAAMCSIVQFTLWFYLLQQTEPGKTSSFLFLVPIFGVLCSWILLGEQVGRETYAGGALVCLGIYLVNRRQRDSR
ncbi:EamA family transporter [Cohnella sp. CFH 77786]|uniref:DMT family transporter n=1 Tax=Cohnella sp. CFH 77786 TaxID=2662265 RepID=UPI001C60DC0C|nr:EamA family transporter [Cohnella sp. CFH 77786]MBW5446358.1 EamA family transporter [Cohnella sp. CFH 77786]